LTFGYLSDRIIESFGFLKFKEEGFMSRIKGRPKGRLRGWMKRELAAKRRLRQWLSRDK